MEETFDNFDAKWHLIEWAKSARFSCRLKVDDATVNYVKITFGPENKLPIDTKRLKLAVKDQEKTCKLYTYISTDTVFRSKASEYAISSS